ncbi:MAG TPA: NAD-dependent epimerase/dehydratase family protein [Gemmatimonadaceae bacterium]|nr:NAD-dependent epimerase/dehydratase family protein [Gemmatimonadaceae bacterium]
MKVLLFGSTGMIGQGVLRECLSDSGVTEVVTVVRASTGRNHPKLHELVHADFTDFSSLQLAADACFWCLGVSSSGMSEADYTRVTHDYTIAAAKAMVRPAMTFVFVSGQGADGKAMWARVKRRTEGDLQAMSFKALYIFRPGFIEPLDGIRSRTRLYNVLYPMLYPLMLAMKALAPGSITDTRRLGRAMLGVARSGCAKQILGNEDINTVAARAG